MHVLVPLATMAGTGLAVMDVFKLPGGVEAKDILGQKGRD